MPICLLHLSDLHLDAAFPALGPERRTDLRAALGRILALARERKVNAVTIAGDLYEQDYALPDTAAFLAQQFERLAPIRVLIAPGERDPYTNDSLYALTRWPENVTIFSQGQLTPVELAPGVTLWGAACPPARGHKTLGGFHVDRAGINLLLLHAADLPGDEGVFTVSAEAVRAAGFDFALLGHNHAARLWPDDAPCCLYPGSPEPLAEEEADGAHQIALLTVQEGGCAVERIPINRWRCHAQDVDLSGCATSQDAVRRVRQAVQADDDERAIWTVTLTGAPDFAPNVAALTAQVEAKAHLRCQARFELPAGLAQWAQEPTVRGLLVRRFQARLAQTDNEAGRRRAQAALLLALRALEGRQVQIDEMG